MEQLTNRTDKEAAILLRLAKEGVHPADMESRLQDEIIGTTTQERMRSLLFQTGIPAKEVKCYGSQIMVTAWSLDAANQWVSVLRKIAKVRKPVETKEQNLVNHDSRRSASYHNVWLVWGTL